MAESVIRLVESQDPRQRELLAALIANGLPCAIESLESLLSSGERRLVVVNEMSSERALSLSRLVKQGCKIVVVPLELVLSPLGQDGRPARLGTLAGRSAFPVFAFIGYSAAAHDENRWGSLSCVVPYPLTFDQDLAKKKAQSSLGDYFLLDFPKKCLPEEIYAEGSALEPVAEDIRPFTDRDHFITKCHKSLDGCSLVKIPDVAREDPSFSLCLSFEKKNTVFVFCDEESDQPPWLFLDGWRRCDSWIDIVESKTRRYRRMRAFFMAAYPGSRISLGPSVQGVPVSYIVALESSDGAVIEDSLESSVAESAKILAEHAQDIFGPRVKILTTGLNVPGFDSALSSGLSARELYAGAHGCHIAVPQREGLLWAKMCGSHFSTSWETGLYGQLQRWDPHAGLSPSGLTGHKQAREWIRDWPDRASFMRSVDPMCKKSARESGQKLEAAAREISFDGGAVLANKLAGALQRAGLE